MDNFELKTEPKIKRKSAIWNVLTVIALLAACGLAYLFLNIYQNPGLVPASLRPLALPTIYQTPTPSATIIPLPATWTPTPTDTPVPNAYQGAHLDIRSVADHGNPTLRLRQLPSLIRPRSPPPPCPRQQILPTWPAPPSIRIWPANGWALAGR